MSNISDAHVKVHFRMEVDEGGWPPAPVESLWAVYLSDGTVRLDNTPWFVRGPYVFGRGGRAAAWLS